MRLLLVALAFAAATPLAFGQSAMPTNNVLTRVLMIESQFDRGTVFSIDVDGREYWITAKHILTGAQHPPYGELHGQKMKLKVLNPEAEGEQWIEREFAIIDTGLDVDEVVLAPATPLLESPLPSVNTTSEAVMLGGNCAFLGFPYGGGWRATFADGRSSWMPFVKQCGVSAMIRDPQRVWILDGINNVGFSGGPVLYKTGTDQRIFAVVSGYRLEPTDVISSGAGRLSAPPQVGAPAQREQGGSNAPRRQTVNLNSGFIIAYDISYAIEAIHKNPIGPIRSGR